jgi:hypothetical protein
VLLGADWAAAARGWLTTANARAGARIFDFNLVRDIMTATLLSSEMRG